MKKISIFIATTIAATNLYAVSTVIVSNVVTAYQTEDQRIAYTGRKGEIVRVTNRPDQPLVQYDGTKKGGRPLDAAWSPYTAEIRAEIDYSGTNSLYITQELVTAYELIMAGDPTATLVTLMIEAGALIDFGSYTIGHSGGGTLAVCSSASTAQDKFMVASSPLPVSHDIVTFYAWGDGYAISNSAGPISVDGIDFRGTNALYGGTHAIMAKNCIFRESADIHGIKVVISGSQVACSVTNATQIGVKYEDCYIWPSAKHGEQAGGALYKGTWKNCTIASTNDPYIAHAGTVGPNLPEVIFEGCSIANASTLFSWDVVSPNIEARNCSFSGASTNMTVGALSKFYDCTGITSTIRDEAQIVSGCTDQNGNRIPDKPAHDIFYMSNNWIITTNATGISFSELP